MTDKRRRVRTRPQKQTLSVAAFTDAAVALLEREGAEAITLRRVAAELQTGPASVYGHVRTIQDLHVLVVDRMMGRVDLHPELGRSPARRVEAVLESYADTLLDHRGLADLVSGLIPYGANTIRLADTIVGCLLRLGLTPGRAAWGYDLLMLRMTAAVAEQDRWRGQTGLKERAEQAYRQADPVEHPHLARARDQMFTGGRARSRWAIRAILAGLAQAPEPSEPAAAVGSTGEAAGRRRR